MSNLKDELVDAIGDFLQEDGIFPTPVSGVYCLKRSVQDQHTKRNWRSCFAIVAQGCKEIVLENETFKAGEFHYTATPVDLPVVSRIAKASHEKPFLAILVDFNSLVLAELTSAMDKVSFAPTHLASRAMFVSKAEDNMIDCAVRLARLFKKTDDATILGPVIIKELFYYLLKSPNGDSIRQLVRSGSSSQKVTLAIHKIKAELSDEINIPDLVETSSMSRSAFFKHFKQMTSLSPIQYQKRLRLLEARRLMLEIDVNAEGAAYKVGYNSATQFNREYARMFGNSPRKDVFNLRQIKKSVKGT